VTKKAGLCRLYRPRGGAKQSAAGRNHFAPERKTEETPRDYSYDNEKNFRGRL